MTRLWEGLRMNTEKQIKAAQAAVLTSSERFDLETAIKSISAGRVPGIRQAMTLRAILAKLEAPAASFK